MKVLYESKDSRSWRLLLNGGFKDDHKFWNLVLTLILDQSFPLELGTNSSSGTTVISGTLLKSLTVLSGTWR